MYTKIPPLEHTHPNLFILNKRMCQLDFHIRGLANCAVIHNHLCSRKLLQDLHNEVSCIKDLNSERNTFGVYLPFFGVKVSCDAQIACQTSHDESPVILCSTF